MKTNQTLRLIVALLFLGVLFQLLTVCTLAQDVGTNALPVIPGVSADAAAGALTALIGALTAKYGWLLTVIAWIGILRAVFKPLMAFVESVVKATPGKADDAA
ncbi:MAG: hypothetical protein V4563_14335, partial [Pseudomonadota bacterium]